MNPNDFTYLIRVEDPGQLLLWLMLLCLLGVAATAMSMAAIGKFFLYEKSNKNNFRTQERFSILQLELPWSFERFQRMIAAMSDKTKSTVRMQLKLDYWFMPFMYLFLFFGGCFVLWCYHKSGSYMNDLALVLWVPLIAWLLDIIENKLIDSSLNRVTGIKRAMLLLVSLVKWIIAVLFFIAAIAAYVMLCFS